MGFFPELQAKDIHKSVNSTRKSFCDGTINEDIEVKSSSNLRIDVIVPIQGKYRNWLDMVQLYVFKDLAILVGTQITLDSAQANCRSVQWLVEEDTMEDTLKSRGFTVQRILLFICSQAESKRVRVQLDHERVCEFENVFDYPLQLTLGTQEIRDTLLSQVAVNKVSDCARALKVMGKRKCQLQDKKREHWGNTRAKRTFRK
jgi:hypothetical protein